ncbi:hypothetical protein ACFVYV_09525 [Streptomyces mirabilis]|uniref:hypothetical protein n=1 Tax=Streptomyces mirabilis TaxID=68239 RepID=UPI0036DA5580
MKNRSEAGKRVATAWGAGTVEYRTDGYAGEVDYYLIKLDAAAEYGVTHMYVRPEDAQPEEIMGEDDSETVWVPVGRGKWNEKRGTEIELAWGEVWTIHRLFSTYRNLRRAGDQYAAMRVLDELKEKGFGLEHHECRDVANWVDAEGSKLAGERGMRMLEEWRAEQGQ